MKYIALIIICLFSITTASAEEIKFSFEWGDIPNCRSGSPNVVSNPIFKLSAIPKGASWVFFDLKDFQSSYKHGGGWVELDGNLLIESGKFEYDSPCPPGVVHTYEWSAYFSDKKQLSWNGKPNKVIMKLKAQKQYP
jgi:hypothetical protein